jgi:hypothetical protein
MVVNRQRAFFSTTSSPNQDNFDSFIENRTILNPWCFEFIDIPSDYSTLLQEIENGNVWLVSDGTFNPTSRTGTAAWILEGITSSLQISGKIITPGDCSDQSAYRSELAGILAAMTVINALTSFHRVSGTITVHCDCETGIEKAFSHFRNTNLHDASHDLLKAIHHEISNSQIRWSGAHIKGHQDDTVPFEQLDRPSQLNVLVDQMAKDLLPIATKSQRQCIVRSYSRII